MRVDPPSSSVTGTVIAKKSAGPSAVDADLADLRTLAAALTTAHGDASSASTTSLSIGWDLPFTGDALSPGTATTCATASLDLAATLTATALRAQLLSTLVSASLDAYELAEACAVAHMKTAIATYSLTVTLAKISMRQWTGNAPSPDTTAMIVGDVVAIIDARLPGSYEENVAGINIGLVRALGTPNPVTTSIVSGPDAPRPAPAVRSVGQSMGRIDDLYENGNDSAHIQVQRVVDPATGQGRWIAMIPGTATFSWNARTPLDGSGNVAAAAGLVSGGEVAVRDALRDAMRREGVLGKGEPVMLVGHSQGGMVMTNLARRRSDGLNVTHVTTYGSPVGAAKLPAGVRTLNIENSADFIHRIDGRATGDGDPGRVRLVIDDPTSAVTAKGSTSIIEPHSHEKYRWNYEAVMGQERGRPGPPSAAVDFETSAAPFFEGEARTYRYDASREPGVEATQNAVTPTLTCTSETTHKPSPTPNFGVGPAGQYRVTSP